MTIEWSKRTPEERHLLNPAFCAVVVWHLLKGYQSESIPAKDVKSGVPIQLAFIGSSFILRGKTRVLLPRGTSTTLTSWVLNHPLERSAVAKGVSILRPFIREALLFGGQHGAILFAGDNLLSNENSSKFISKYLQHSSNEARECAKKALFVGRWFSKAGTPSTIMTLLGVHT